MKPKNLFDANIRRAYIEAILFRDGEIYSGVLFQIGTGRGQTSIDFRWFNSNFPGLMKYDISKKRYFRADKRIKPKLNTIGQHAAIISAVELLSSVSDDEVFNLYEKWIEPRAPT